MRVLSGVGWVLAVVAGLLWWSGSDHIPAPVAANDGQPGAQELKKQREVRLRAMHEQIKSVSVKSKSDTVWVESGLHEEPLFRYADVPRGILEASLWCWGRKGRPVALTKLEMVGPQPGLKFGPGWQYCIASLAEQPIQVTWPSEPPFTASKTGVSWQSVPEAPEVNDKSQARMRQMKELVKRFAATIFVDGKEDLKQEMRQLASPIHRYSDADTGLTDGAIFGFSTNGTNPDVLLVIEAASKMNSPARWRFAVVGMTWAEYRVRLDEVEVLRMPFPPPRDTWEVRRLPRND